MKDSIDLALQTNAAVGATTTWVLSNHDVVRHASRFGLRDATSWPKGIGAHQEQPDAELGLSRARAATLMVLALPGSAYIYEGEELGLPEHTTLPDEVRQDPSFARTGGVETGRDGARVPIPWVADAPAYGFSPTGASWLPQPAAFRALAADRQEGVAGSTLELYREALRLRREHALGRGALEWTSADANTLAFTNRGVRVLANFGPRPALLPAGARILLASEPDAVSGGALAPNRTVWLT
jgi:alpha-glucosidase